MFSTTELLQMGSVVAGAAVATLFSLSAANKVVNLSSLEQSVGRFSPLPHATHLPLGVAALLTELFIVISIAIGTSTAIIGFGVSILLASIYTLLQAISLMRGVEVECDCFYDPSSKATMTSNLTILRNLLIIFVASSGFGALFVVGNQAWALPTLAFLLLVLLGLVLAFAIKRLPDTFGVRTN